MGNFDFTYELPNNFKNIVIQLLQQKGKKKVADAFQRCKYDLEDVGLAYYAGLKGDNWNKHAVDFTFEGLMEDITLLKDEDCALKEVIEKALKPSVSGYLVRDIVYLNSDISIDDTIFYSSNEERLNAVITCANMVLSDLMKICERVSLNNTYNISSYENSINDYFRDMLIGMGYNEVKDQTRHGISSSGKDAGEVDLLLTKDNKEIAIFEGFKLTSVSQELIDSHINKAIINYNALGTATFIVAYVCVANFEAFWSNYFNHIENYKFALGVKMKLKEFSHPNASTRVANMILTRDGYDFPVYFIAIKIK